ncbi:hypothetical protein P22_0715 [Propionispora sp. 2/2-37]|uniref:precorrin-2 C(20)-methyltransferase n=1 Tax=Propionispora sp. 2/2-37 TaxID=1677858 RepID=UPI0006BB86C6|nr:precorrin-2 C(20)-methyltransferase [Propionispora sp. 2/2-37]CUH94649.1 hypothetical protein P22_0715 [Propionispora sp. 2/2-37]
MSGIFYGIGVGPGDPELLTLKAVSVIREADVIIAPKTEKKEDSVALSIAKPFLKKDVEILKLVFPMVSNNETLTEAWQYNKDVIVSQLDAGKKVIFLTLGDPMFYSTYIYVFRLLENCGYPIETIPGVPAFCAIGSKLGYPLVEGNDILSIIPATASEEKVERALAITDNVVLMKVYKNVNEIIDKLDRHNLSGNAVMISRCGLPEEEIIRDFSELKDKKVNYLSTILSRRV